jgi:uncharacterized protein
MRSGVHAIVQAGLGSGDWRGRADVLIRVERLEKPSGLGHWSYELVDCKLARETKAETILQLCLYSELVTELQGLEPEYLHVIRPNVGFQPESYRLAAFAAYYRVVKSALLEAVKTSSNETYPEPVSHCEICRWWKECDGRRRRDDHLSFVAGPPNCNARSSYCKAFPISNPWQGSQFQYVAIRPVARVKAIRGFENKPEFSWKLARKAS